MEADPESNPVRGVLCAEAVGYDRMAASDGEPAAEILRASADIIRHQARAFGGEPAEHEDDDLVVFFLRPAQAVSCALALQSAIEQRNTELPTEQRLFFRVGVGIAHAEESGDTGIEVARRVRSLADPGGICVSGHAFDEVEGRLPVAFDDLGLQAVRSLPRPVRVYRALKQPDADPADWAD